MKKNQLILCALLLPFLIAFALNAAAERVYYFDINLTSSDEVFLRSAQVMDGYATTFSTLTQPYAVKIYSENDEELFNGFLLVSFDILAEPPIDIRLDSIPLNLKVPYTAGGVTMKLFHYTTEIYSYDLLKFCNKDGACQASENIIGCPEDCRPESPVNETTTSCGDGICAARENDLTCPQDCKAEIPVTPTDEPERSPAQWIFFIAFIVILITVIVIVLLKIMRPKQGEPAQKQNQQTEQQYGTIQK